MNFKDKIVIVSGAGSGIGRAISQLYGSMGAIVIIAEKDRNLGKQTEEIIVKNSGQACFYHIDVSKAEDIYHLIDEVEKRFNKIDILVNNAGIAKWKSPYDLEIEEWDDILNTNLRSVFLCSREVAKVMRRNKGGSIVNIASTRAFMSEPNSEAYAASKGGIIALTHAMATSLSVDRIRVNAISPGWIETGDYKELRPVDHNQHLSKRVGRPADVARACIYLTKEDNDFINGTNLIIDGGMTKKMIYEP